MELNPQNRKILYLVNYFVAAGVENFVLTLANSLERSLFKPYIGVLIKSDDSFTANLYEDVELVSFNKKSGHDIGAWFRISKFIKKNKIDVIHVNNWGTFIDGVILKILNPNIKLIHVQHGLEYATTLNASFVKNFLRKLIRYLFVHIIDEIVSVSAIGAQYLKKEWGAQNVHLIYNGIDLKKFKTKPPESGHKKKQDFKICTIGRIVPVKNFHCLFKAINLLKDKIPNLKLYHIGAIPVVGQNEEGRILKYISENNLTGYVEFMGYRNDIHLIFSDFDVFSLTSLSEGLSLAILESQAAGIPAVITEVGGNPEIVVNNKNGFLVPTDDEKAVADAIFTLYENAELRGEMAKNARKRAEKLFDLDKMIRQYQELYLKK